MDLFAKAIMDRINGDNADFFFIDKNDKRFVHNLDRYYKTPFPATRLEKKLIKLCYGDILDVGSATGNYFPELMKQGTVTGVEYSTHLVKIAKKQGITNIAKADIFSYKASKKFDTITLLENNLCLGGSEEKTKELIKKLLILLKEDGKILSMISKRAKDNNFFIAELTAEYKGKKGTLFKYFNINPNYLNQMCKNMNCNIKILGQDERNYLLELKKER